MVFLPFSFSVSTWKGNIMSTITLGDILPFVAGYLAYRLVHTYGPHFMRGFKYIFDLTKAEMEIRRLQRETANLRKQAAKLDELSALIDTLKAEADAKASNKEN